MNKILLITTMSCIVLVLLVPQETFAQGNFVDCDGGPGDPCSWCNLIHTANYLIGWLIGILFVIAGIVAAWAGIKLVTSGGNVSARESAKGLLINAIIGLIIVFAAWLIVDTIMKTLAGSNSSLGPWNELECWSQNQAQAYTREGPGPDPYNEEVAGEVPPPATPGGTLTQAEAEAQLAGSNISVSSSGNCTDPNNSTCTSLHGIRPTTLSRTQQLQQAVGAPIVITGATETGHSTRGPYTHGNGYKVDLRTTPALNNYITSNYTHIGGTKWKDPHGNIYYRHGPNDHWDVTITN